jgi:hypothetical protein
MKPRLLLIWLPALSLMVELSKTTVALFTEEPLLMPPVGPVAVLPVTVLLMIARVLSKFVKAAPSTAELSLTVELLTVMVPLKLLTPPPEDPLELALIVL